jgi:hypothetical protein
MTKSRARVVTFALGVLAAACTPEPAETSDAGIGGSTATGGVATGTGGASSGGASAGNGGIGVAGGCAGVDLQTDPANCGACGIICPSGQNSIATCTNGACGIACTPGYGNCDLNAANGCESNLTNSIINCGACGQVCPARPNIPATCTDGVCSPGDCFPYGDCDGNAANGCETNLMNDASDCGACGNICPSGPNSKATCSNGACGIACTVGYGDCDANAANGCETALTTPADCGACGSACAAGELCTTGACAPVDG